MKLGNLKIWKDPPLTTAAACTFKKSARSHPYGCWPDWTSERKCWRCGILPDLFRSARNLQVWCFYFFARKDVLFWGCPLTTPANLLVQKKTFFTLFCFLFCFLLLFVVGGTLLGNKKLAAVSGRAGILCLGVVLLLSSSCPPLNSKLLE